MQVSLEAIRSELPELSEEIIRDHLESLTEDYFRSFTNEDIKNHLIAISKLSSDNPVEVIIGQKRDGSVECTILAFDYPSEFSLITGILAASGFNIDTGDIYTYEEVREKKKKRKQRQFAKEYSFTAKSKKRRKIIDFFSGMLEGSVYSEKWALELQNNLREIIKALEEGTEISIEAAKNRVNELVVRHLSNINPKTEPVLYPVEIGIDNDAGPFTRLRVVSEDTPAFLYSLSNALSLNSVLIEHVRIRTIRGRVEDRLDFVDARGRKVEDSDTLDRIKLSVLLIKQFTYFLGKAPDPYVAISRFEQIVKNSLEHSSKGQWIAYLSNSDNLRDMARLLGASDFLWEDFIHLQYESLIPLFGAKTGERLFSDPPESMQARLSSALEDAGSLEDKKKTLNDFKDRETFLIDLDHILNPEKGFHFLEEKLTSLAELVIKAAAKCIYDNLIERYGEPRSIAGLATCYSIFGLGKLGGVALGYASDIEFLFVYKDNGKTDGKEPVENSVFFDQMVKGIFNFIESKREGIFQVDLRLRPHGDSGPLACSMESFCNYYGQGGEARSYERLSLVRMRYVAGDRQFGMQMERIRDEIIYYSNFIDLSDLRELRERQFSEKSVKGRTNAKFSPGGLVDLEYGIQVLQTMYGRDNPAIRTARMHDAMRALNEVAGVLSEDEVHRLIDAYNFLRDLINGLRMLRGSAKDLFLPGIETKEFGHLARRMGYARGGPIDSDQRLHLDVETHMAVVRVFSDKYFGRDDFSDLKTGTIVDVILYDDMPDSLKYKILSEGGFNDPRRAFINLKGLAGKGSRRDTFARAALLAWDIIRRVPDPDMALNNWERYINSIASPEFHFNVLLSQPMQLEILLTLFSSSQFLSDTLIRNPGFFGWLTMPDVLHQKRKREDIEKELGKSAENAFHAKQWLNKIRRLRRREILRIGTRDIYLGISTRVIMQELSILAEACVQVAFKDCLRKFLSMHDKDKKEKDLNDGFCIMAFGKLGGNELNYSSDIDLLGIYSDPVGYDTHYDIKNIYTKIMEGVISELSSHTEEGYAYRVDMRLRPFGSSGELVQNILGIADYYQSSASHWEIQAALKLRPIAGNLRLGYELIDLLRPIIYKQRNRKEIVRSINNMRDVAVRSTSRNFGSTMDIKTGIGGIRDIEFMVQGLQLIHAHEYQALIEGNTLLAIEALVEAEIIPDEEAIKLKNDYIFLRKTEHYLQILEDRQIHSLPEKELELKSLSKRMLGVDAESDQFMEELTSCLKRVREAFENYLSIN